MRGFPVSGGVGGCFLGVVHLRGEDSCWGSNCRGWVGLGGLAWAQGQRQASLREGLLVVPVWGEWEAGRVAGSSQVGTGCYLGIIELRVFVLL